MQDVEIIGLLKTYVQATLVGMGALKGANCSIQSITTSGLNHVVTFAWKDDDGVSHTDTMTVTDGRSGTDGTDGTDGVGITSIEKTSTVGLVDTYTITLTNGVTQDFTVTNGKDGTGGSIAEMTDVTITGVSDGQILRYNATTHKWENASLANVARTGDYNDLINPPTLGTAAEKNSTNQVVADSTDLVESGAVHEAIANAVSAVYKPSGDKTVAELISSLLVAANLGNVYNITDSGVTTADFVGGAGQTINSGDSVAIIDAGSGVYMFDLLSGFVDLSGYYTKTETDNAIDTEIKKLDVSDSAVAGSYVTQVTETDGKISVTREAADAAPAENSNKLVKSGGVYAGLAGKADKVSSATNGNFAGLDTNGNLTDSGKKASDFATAEGFENEVVTRSAMGAKNLIPFPYPKASDTVLGIDFTTNSNGEIIVSGTSTGIAVYDVVNTELYGWNNIPREGTYILSDGLSDADYVYAYTAVTFMYDDGTIEYNVGDTSVGRTVITIPSNLKNFYIGCCVRTDKTVSNIKFKPMLRLATDADSTYQLYAMTNQQITPYVQAISNPNLLDNPWFTVNQRGQSSYSTSGAYSVDRWKLYNGAVTVNSDKSITITTSQGKSTQLQNRIDPLASAMLQGKQVTLSAIVNNVLYTQTFIYEHYEIYQSKININDTWVFDFRNIPNDGDSGHLVRFFTSNSSDTSSITVKAVKLELGSVSTLAMDTAPNYQQELAKCQRYYVRYTSEVDNAGSTYRLRAGYGMAVGTTLVQFLLFTPVEMRAVPTIKYVGIGAYVPEKQDALISIADNSLIAVVKNGNVVNVKWETTGLVKGYVAMLWADGADNYIELSADL